jgi:hypothetical protein
MEPTPENIAKALRRYEAQQRAWTKYNDRKREEKKANGTYRPRGRPPKNKYERTEEDIKADADYEAYVAANPPEAVLGGKPKRKAVL